LPAICALEVDGGDVLMILDDGEATTGIRESRGARERGRRLRLLPGEGGRGSWSEHDAGVHRVTDDGVDLRQNRPVQMVREKRREEEESLGGEGEDRAYLRRRNRAENAHRHVTPTTNRGSLAALSERGKREAEGGGVGDL
jgi:hypothetical protein